MSIFDRILTIITDSGSIPAIIGGLLFFCLLFGILIIRKFFTIWQAEAEKTRLYKDLIYRYEAETDLEKPPNGSNS